MIQMNQISKSKKVLIKFSSSCTKNKVTQLKRQIEMKKVNIHFGKQRCSNERAKHYRIRLQSKERGREREEER